MHDNFLISHRAEMAIECRFQRTPAECSSGPDAVLQLLMHLCTCLQDTDPLTRWTPRQALQHPYITRAPFIGPFQPPPEPHPHIRLPPASASPAASQLNPGLLSSLSYQGLPASIPASIAAALATSPEAQRQVRSQQCH